MNHISQFLLLLSILSLLYYTIIILYAGIRASFSWFWLLSGIMEGIFSLVFLPNGRGAIYLKREGQMILLFIMITAAILFLAAEGFILYYRFQKPDKDADYAIILGAQIKGETITKSLKYRLDEAIAYLEENKRTTAIVSGGKGEKETISEAEAMERYLIAHGIHKRRIRKEDKSTNTYENILYSKVFLKGSHERIVIISNGFHIFRSVSIAKKQKIGIIKGLSAKTDPILFLNYYVRECFAVGKDIAAGNIVLFK